MKYILPAILSFIFILQLSTETKSQTYIRKVVIDAGHGGKDPGALGKNNYEKDLALKIALKLGFYINKYLPDVEIIYTRETDKFVELHERANIANREKADLFISIHLNSSTMHEPYGASTYLMGVSKSNENLEIAKIENSVITYENDYAIYYQGFDPEKPETEIILSLKQNSYIEQSLNFALKVQNQFRTRGGRKDLGAKQAGFLVLWTTTMPSVLIETGFISNPVEEKFLASAQGQDIIASGIFRAFRDYKAEKEKKVSGLVSVNDAINEQSNENPVKRDSGNPNEKHKTEPTKVANISKKESVNSIIFRVQVSSSPTPLSLKSSVFKGLQNVEELVLDKVYKYTVGSTSNFSEIQTIQTDVKKKIPDAFIIALKNGKKISVKQARDELANLKMK